MIELDGIKALRYREEDVYRLREELIDSVPEGVDWFMDYVQNLYSHMNIIAILYDAGPGYVWVLLADYDYMPISSVELDHRGKPYIQERVKIY